MLRSAKDLRGFDVEATDGTIGKIADLYFDDASWTVRWVVVQTGDWLARREVLISPVSVGAANRDRSTITTSLSRAQVRKSPDIDTQKPVSRQHEVEHYAYYGYPGYWGGTGLWGDETQPSLMLAAYRGSPSPELARREEEYVATLSEFHRQKGDDAHLRSCLAIERYHIHASDGDIGHLEDVLIDAETWSIRYLVVDTSDWWFGRHVLVAPRWIDDISWLDATVTVDTTRQTIKHAPPFDPSVLPDRVHEVALHSHHGRPGYWTEADRLETDISRI